MEKIQCICLMRDLMKVLAELEHQLEETHGVTLNEAMVLCSIGDGTISAGNIITCTGMTPSHASKTIRSAEDKGLLTRRLGEQDKRQMYFGLARKGKNCLKRIKEQGLEIPEWLASLLRAGQE